MSISSQNYFDVYSTTDDLKLFSLLSTNIHTRCIYIGVKDGLFLQIESGVEDLNILAKNLGYNTERLHRLLKNFEHLNLVKEKNENQYELTSSGKKLLPNTKGSFAHLALLWGEEFQEVTNHLHEILKSEKSGFECAYKENVYSYLESNLKMAENFNLAMRGVSEYCSEDVLHEIDLNSANKIADIGGGSGANLRAFITNNSHLNGILFDQKSVIDKAIEEMETFQHKNRVELIAGDFFKPFSFKVDVIILSKIIHNWDDERAVQILTNCRNALNDNGKIYLIEWTLEHEREPLTARTMDINMMIATCGKVRSFKEFGKLFDNAGLKFSQAKNISNKIGLIEVTTM
ncbi:methyltransferase [Silvanigrella sp.]|jgi:cyclopropane fatty-acyl-phospholipid synthase-like methyltransferase|uniref:methyltransferase n=1 Tax=Silvanigrella sp. TaxID=2024976 RepID=UPI0037CC35DB|nr:methyltransferase [Silvanigrellaceae bacterium]